MAKDNTNTTVFIAISPIVSGVVSWARRIRTAFQDLPEFTVKLVSTRGAGELSSEIDVVANTPRELIEVIHEQGGGILIANYIWDLFYPAAKAIASGKDLRLIGYCRADSEKEYYTPLSDYAPLISQFVGVSQTCTDQLVERKICDPQDATTLPTCVEIGPERKTDTSNRHPVKLVYAGRIIQHQKRVFDIPAIIARLEERGVNYQLQIAGEGQDEQYLKTSLASSVRAGYTKFLGSLAPKDVLELFRTSHMFVQCSEFEGTSNSMLEAMGQGCVPIVSQTQSGTTEVITPSRNGYLFEIGNTEQAATSIQRAWECREKWTNLSRASQTTCLAYSIPKHCETLSSIWRSALSDKTRRVQAQQWLKTHSPPPSFYTTRLQHIKQTVFKISRLHQF